ncbi:hypothetical protein K469DRAFT_712441 [Zopfia rhizophila CBS 207.26]|uniref:Retrovirus-related Pol polyprotein from transposon TNT 1-94-like beta-barrel domain-containing protein n=1 Tax=Zopfia rhizophila CBS 207.26 TaxID=1314779 RepID=A0A6A6ESA1_9PEZI|nr:hypothetical protein K469DRAFT_712441 [Zopfia rhizophila CBS 207.26]
MDAIDKYIFTHTTPEALSTVSHITDLHGTLVALKGLFCPTIADRDRQIADDYKAVQALDAKTQNVDIWAQNFLQVYQRAVKVKIPEVTGFRTQKDLVRLINPLEPALAANMSLKILEAEENWKEDDEIPKDLQFPSLLNKFLKHHRSTKTSTTAGVNHSAFATSTLNGEERPSQKRKRSSSSSSYKPKNPCLCGEMHMWRNCGYIVEEARDEDFEYEKEKANLVRQKIKESTAIKGIVKKVQQKAKKLREETKAPKKRKPNVVELDSKAPVELPGSPSAHAICSTFSQPSKIYQEDYPLLYTWILDPASDIHVCSNEEDFTFIHPATDRDEILAGGSSQKIEAWGEATITIQTPDGPAQTTLRQVAFIPSFFTSVVSLSRLTYSSSLVSFFELGL